MTKNTICLWYNNDAEEAAHFYARTFPESRDTAVQQAPSDYPGGKAGWQITPRVLTEAMAAGGDMAKRAFAAMKTMHKIDVAKIEAAIRG